MGEIRTNGGFTEQTVECGHFQKFLHQVRQCGWHEVLHGRLCGIF